jgi:hypothetical protein
MSTPVISESTDFANAARQKFAALTTAFATDGSYWRLGHAFDTVLDYFSVVSADGAADFGATVKHRFADLTSPDLWSGYWYDDHGWWGVAALRASGQSKWFGSLAEDFEQISQRCWTTMDEMAPTVWVRRPKPGGADPFATLEPRFDGGVWNSEWSLEGSPPCDPTSDGARPLCGYQNTVTNMLYLILAARRYALHHLAPDQVAADREYTFLERWMHITPGSDALVDFYELDRLLVRAEVSTYKSGETVAEYDSNFVWTGDQGLFLGALVERMGQVGKGQPEYRELFARVKALLAGTHDRLAPGQMLKPWHHLSPAAQTDPGDYATGPAVFFRYLLHAYQANDDLKAFLTNPQTIYPTFIRANAEHAAKQASDGDMVALTNDLATLVAAVAMLS